MNSYKTLLVLGILVLVFTAGLAGCVSTGGGGSSPAPIAGGASGTATGTAAGFNGEIKVTVTMENGNITDVQIDAPGETPTIGGIAIERAPGIIIRNNSAEIDTISGASVTSSGIATAAQAAIDQITASN